jgi:lipopolysaccharide biosynthesis glycosyltransferase
VLNLLFDGKVTYLPAAYNLILSQSPELIETKKLSPDEIKILHFTGKYKPWKASEKMDELIVDPYYSAFINDWKDAYNEVKQKLEGKYMEITKQ